MSKLKTIRFLIDHHAVVAIILQSLQAAGVQTGYLAQWYEHIEEAVRVHSNPKAAADAMIVFHEALNLRVSPPPDPDSQRGKQIHDIIQTVAKRDDPIAFINGVVLISTKCKRLKSDLIPVIFQAYLTYEFSDYFCMALVTLSKTGLLDGECAAANFTQFMPVIETWFGNKRMAKLFIDSLPTALTQGQFDALIAVSQALLPDQSNLQSVRSNVAQALSAMMIDTPPVAINRTAREQCGLFSPLPAPVQPSASFVRELNVSFNPT